MTILKLTLFLATLLCQERAAGQIVNSANPVEKPNILLLVSEDNGPQLGCYGDTSACTPRLDQLAMEGVRFSKAFVPYSVCSPSRAAFLTGLHPQQNGQIGLATHGFSMTEKFASLPSLLIGAGYRTGIIGKLHVNPASAFPFGFKRFSGSNFSRRRVPEFAAAAREFFRADKVPFFLAVNFPDAHFPLIPQQDGLPVNPSTAEDVQTLSFVGVDSPRLRQATADYYSCMARLDAGVGMVLDELKEAGLAENTLVIYIGDHGAQFSRGKTSCYDAGLRVPFLVRWPGHVKTGLVRDELVSTLDILPTVCEAIGVEIPPHRTGRNLEPLFNDGKIGDWRTHVFAMGTGSAPVLGWLQFAVRGERYKLIINPQSGAENRSARAYLEQHNQHFIAGTNQTEVSTGTELVKSGYATWLRPPKLELYDLRADPNEWNNLAASEDHAVVRKDLLQELKFFRKSIADPFLNPNIQERFLSEQQAALSHPYRKDPGFSWTYSADFRAAVKGHDVADVLKLDSPFDHHFILPCNVSNQLSGKASANEVIRVHFADTSVSTKADANGKWRVELPPQSPNPVAKRLLIQGEVDCIQLLGVTVGESTKN
jgi:N-sulfoglucosamine sulfohydrolase